MKNKMPRQYELVTIVDNETNEETLGHILEYTKERIVIKQLETFDFFGKLQEIKFITFDAKKVHFKD